MRDNREKLIRLMRSLNRIDGQYELLRRTLELKESLFVLLYACVDGERRSQKEICDEWHIPRSTLNTVVVEQVCAGNVVLIPRGNKEKDVCLTQKGRQLAEQKLGSLLDAEERIAADCIDDLLLESIERFADEMEDGFGCITA